MDVENIKKDDNFWAETVKFTDTILTPDIEAKFVAYCKEKKYNHNEIQLFKHFIKEAVGLKLSVADLKHLKD